MRRALLATLLLLTASAHAAGWDKLSGQASEIKEPLNVVVKTEADWETLWKRHSGGDVKSLPGHLKDGETVVAVFLGERRTAGVKVVLEPMPDPLDQSKLVVYYSEVRPKGDDGMSADVISYPFAMIKLEKPYSSVEIAANTRCRILKGSLDAKTGAHLRDVGARATAFALRPIFD